MWILLIFKKWWWPIYLSPSAAVACLYQNKWPGVQFYTPPPKKSLKNLNQKWVKCCMKAPIRQVLLKTSLFVVHFSKRYLKALWWTFLMKNQLQTDVFMVFAKSLSSVLSISSLSTVTSLKSLQQSFWLTLVLCSRGSQMAICYDFLLYRVVICEALTLNLTEQPFLLEQAVQSV